MARPKSVQDGTKLNLYVPRAVKRHLFELATAHRRSLSSMVTELVMAERAGLLAKSALPGDAPPQTPPRP